MSKLVLSIALIFASPVALAHEGHGVSMSSLSHYFTGPHLLATLAVAAVVVSVGLLVSARRRSN